MRSLLRSVLLLALLAAPAGAQQPVGPTLEDLFRFRALDDVQLSADGAHVLYTVGETLLDENKTDTDVWLVRTAGGAPVQLTRDARRDTRPRWRPDGGGELAFLSARGEGERAKSALYVMSAFGGEAEKLYEHATGIVAYEWSPDGRSIAFTAPEEERGEKKETKEKGRDVELEDGPTTHDHLWLLDVATKKARRLTGRGDAAGEYTVPSFDWSPDGAAIAFSTAPSKNLAFAWRTDLYVVATTDTAALPRRIVDNPGPDSNPVYSPDGRWIYFSGYSADSFRVGQSRRFRVSPAGGAPQDVSPGDMEPRDVFPTADGFYFTAVEGTVAGLYYARPGAAPVRVTPAAGVYGEVSLTPDARRVAYVHQSPVAPAEVHTATLSGGANPRLAQARALTTHNERMKQYAVGRSEVVKWRSTDGREVEGVLVYPANVPAGRRAPLVVKIHGGPAGVYTQNFQAGGWNNNAHWYAADGYAMLMPNPRGSSGYGDASQRAVIGDWGGLDFQDIMTGVDAVIARGIAHPDSLGVMGWSYGGYMTAWTVTQTDRFKAAVNGAGITEPIAMWGTQDIIQVFEAYFGGGPFEDGRWDVYQKSSPMAHVRNAKTPTLMIHGKNDARVPPNQAQIFFRALRALGVPTELVWLPRTPHGPNEPGLQYETARRQKEWMDRWIRGRGEAPRPVSD